ncbi:MAG TPA: hypothetical protein VN428_00905 [Bryobacteraceae bacterium]|nr:hypothetical protein [Bryobacteraceae bacterium]
MMLKRRVACGSRLAAGLVRTTLTLIAIAATLPAAEFSFTLDAPAEVLADIEMPAGAAGGAVIALQMHGREPQQVTWFTGMHASVFLGALPPGRHTVQTNATGLRFRPVAPGTPDYEVVANAPILYARPDTVGRLTDVPLLVYCERLDGALQYTVIYSNEDGGTSTRALMARWGRTTDIEYTYRATPAGEGAYQAKDHKDLEFRGKREGAHPVLFVSTANNMVSDEGAATVRYQLAPLMVDLTGLPREAVMDQHPWMYRAAARELEREEKLRPYRGGAGHKENIGDPRQYLYVDFTVKNDRTAVSALVRRKASADWESSDLGRLDYAVSRSGSVRVAVELPPETKAGDIAEIGLACQLLPDEKGKWPDPRPCEAGLDGVLFLDAEYAPVRDPRFTAPIAPIEAGTIRTVKPR